MKLLKCNFESIIGYTLGFQSVKSCISCDWQIFLSDSKQCKLLNVNNYVLEDLFQTDLTSVSSSSVEKKKEHETHEW